MLSNHAMTVLILFGVVLTVTADANIQENDEKPRSSLTAFLRSYSQASEEPSKRIRKSISTGDNCNKWSGWINEHNPTLTEKSENESLSQDALDEFCPPSVYGEITEVECKDDVDNVFIGEREDVDHQYHIICDADNKTVECAPNRADFHQCPDLAIRYFCSCTLPIGYDGADDVNSEEDEQICEELSDTIMMKQFLPLQSSLLVLIILCSVILALTCNKQLKDGLLSKSKLVSPL